MVEYIIIGVLLMAIVIMGAVIALLFKLCVLILENIYLRISFLEIDTKAIVFGLQKLDPAFSPEYRESQISNFTSEPGKDAIYQPQPPPGGLD